jgi:hypothetical protein
MTRIELHRLVDQLPDESVNAAGILLRRARDPLVAALEAAPLDDEPYAEDHEAASDEGWAAYRQGPCAKSIEAHVWRKVWKPTHGRFASSTLPDRPRTPDACVARNSRITRALSFMPEEGLEPPTRGL